MTESNIIHVITSSPAMMYSIDVEEKQLISTHLDRHLDTGYHGDSSRFQIAALKNLVLVFDPEVIPCYSFDSSYSTLAKFMKRILLPTEIVLKMEN